MAGGVDLHSEVVNFLADGKLVVGAFELRRLEEVLVAFEVVSIAGAIKPGKTEA